MTDLRNRSITADVKQKAHTRFNEMVADKSLTLHQTSAIWYEDVEQNPEFLVIYAAEHLDDEGKLRRDGFSVSVFLQTLFLFNLSHFLGGGNSVLRGTDSGGC